MRVLSIIGTRPQAIKMARVIHALEKNPAFHSSVCVTGQHRELLDSVLRLFHIVPNYNLKVVTKKKSLSDITAQILKKLPPIFEKGKPDLVLVQGDASTAFSASLAAYYHGISVAHIEAGLRTFDFHSPFPEEANRHIVSRLSTVHFAPTEVSKSNLVSENIESNRIYVTGNTVIDALLWTRNRVIYRDFSYDYGSANDVLHSGLPILLVTGHRRESLGKGLENICRALRYLAIKHQDWHFVYPVHLNPNVQSIVYKHLSDIHNMHLIGPLDYAPFVQLMNRSKLIISDSGGIQEEAPSLGKPVLVTRDVTERPEAIAAGTALMVGLDFDRIVHETETLMQNDARYARMVGMRNPYGDGKSSERIVSILAKHFKKK